MKHFSNDSQLLKDSVKEMLNDFDTREYHWNSMKMGGLNIEFSNRSGSISMMDDEDLQEILDEVDIKVNIKEESKTYFPQNFTMKKTVEPSEIKEHVSEDIYNKLVERKKKILIATEFFLRDEK